ncbi:MAG: 4-(cytidine 5'-diphospho)-2-C-methyl-D-erythritol kinase, partial [Deltaproteobacteria bacterium]|nr:4-(cytidine 5'-diphospho)-2-C-methyl-D-erythritol kinase [Deltaproteobacteria bacterium]
KEHLSREGAEGTLMTGSGPSVFGVFSQEEEAASAAEKLREDALGEVFLATDWRP